MSEAEGGVGSGSMWGAASGGPSVPSLDYHEDKGVDGLPFVSCSDAFS